MVIFNLQIGPSMEPRPCHSSGNQRYHASSSDALHCAATAAPVRMRTLGAQASAPGGASSRTEQASFLCSLAMGHLWRPGVLPEGFWVPPGTLPGKASLTQQACTVAQVLVEFPCELLSALVAGRWATRSSPFDPFLKGFFMRLVVAGLVTAVVGSLPAMPGVHVHGAATPVRGGDDVVWPCQG